MAINTEVLGPQNSEEAETFAIEAMVFAVQIALQKAMTRRGVGNKELAERLGMSPARVSQIFSTKGANLTLKTIARIQHALGEDFDFVSKEDLKSLTKHAARPAPKIRVSSLRPTLWKETTPDNNNWQVSLEVAA